MNEPLPPITEGPRKNNTVLYIVIGVVVLCACCAAIAGVYWLWNNGDRLLEGTKLLLPLLG